MKATPIQHINPVTASPCAHCGEPVHAPNTTEEPVFCCVGCASVHAALTEAGLQNTFYQLRETHSTAAPSPPPPKRAELKLAELDSPSLLEEQTKRHKDGSRIGTFRLEGVHCAGCVWLVEHLPLWLPGIVSGRLNLGQQQLHLRWHPSIIRLSSVAEWLSRFGYHLEFQGVGSSLKQADRRMLTRMGIAWALAGNIMLLAFAEYAGMDLIQDGVLATGARWLSLALAGAAVIIGAGPMIRRAWQSIRLAARTKIWTRLHMDTPISLGILVGFGASAWSTWTGAGMIWFDSVAVLIAALLTARWLQFRTHRKAKESARRLLQLLPRVARLVDTEGQLRIIPTEELAPGMEVHVAVGEAFPVDGVVVEGRTHIDRSLFTGESLPQRLDLGAQVEAGVINLSAPVRVKALAIADHTRLGQMLQRITAQSYEPSDFSERTLKLSGYFTLIVLTLAVGTALLWSFIDPSQVANHLTALLVITCPCALGMAIPLATAVATGRAAKAGIFIKHPDTFSILAQIPTVVFDKTGTLTEGHLQVVAHKGRPQAFQLASALETHVEHPIARALIRTYPPDSSLDVQLDSIRIVSGKGVSGKINGMEVLVGQPEWVIAHLHTPNCAAQETLDLYLAQGLTPVAIAVEGMWSGLIGLSDPIRQDAAPTISTLENEGHQLILLSGDHPMVAHKVGNDLGFLPHRIHGSVTPEKKQALVAKWKSLGPIVMVGDGVNDAEAMQAAHAGIAVAGSTAASQVASDVFITQQGIRPLLQLMQSARQVMQLIRRNLTFALIYNAFGATAAIAGFVHPLVAAIAMPISSLLLVAASLHQSTFSSTVS